MHHYDLTLLDPWLRYLWETSATDLHFSVGSVPRVRIDGKLMSIPEAAPTDESMLTKMIDGLLVPEDRELYLEDRQLDFAFPWGEVARFRANAFFQKGEPALALRLIPSGIPTPEQLGLPPATANLVQLPHGLVLVTGPTGSGKSTTLAAMIGWINQHRPVHILTIEDPVEYVHNSSLALVNQREVGDDATSFENALRAALREDPDVVLVGEMRDLESIALTLTLAETGHLVFATLHTNDSAQTIDRIIDVFPPDQQDQIRTQISMALAAVVSQRLVPKIGGGRVAAYEVLIGTSAITNLIREGKIRQVRNVVATGTRDGMCVLEQSLAMLVHNGVISMEDAVASSVHPEDIAGYAQQAAQGAFGVTTAQTVLVAVFGVLIMSAVGSFMCVIIDRLPKYLDEPNEYNERWDTNSWSHVLGGNSRCSSCGVPVRARDNIPVLSWLLLRGRCRNPECAERIPSFHPLVELAVPAFSAAIVVANGWSWWLLPWIALVPVGVAIAVIDWRTLMVPTRLVWPWFALIVVLSVVASLAEGDAGALLGGLIGIAVLSGPLFILWWIQPTGIGFGDVRLTVLLGWAVGSAAMAVGGPWTSALFIALVTMVVASFLGLLAGVATLGRPLPSTLQYLQDQGSKRTPFRKRPVPFGPPLVVAALLALIVVEPFVEPFI